MEQKTDISTNIILRVLAIVAGIWFLYVIRDVIALFLIAIILTASLHPIITKLMRLSGLPRTATVSVVYILLFAILTLLAVVIFPTISNQFEKFIAEIAPKFGNSQLIAQLFSAQEIRQVFTGSFDNLLSTTADIIVAFIAFFAAISMSFYMSIQEDGLKKSLLLITPQQHHKYIISLTERIQDSFGRWMAGQLVTMVFVGVLYYIALTILGVPFAGLLALFGGLLEIVPYFGPIVASIPAIAIAFSISPLTATLVAVSYLAINIVENQVLIPKIMNKAIGLNPVLIILALLMGAKIGGVIGILLAVPLAGALGVFIKDVIEKKIV